MFPYLSWHYRTKLTQIVKIWNNLIIFLWHYFSVSELLVTLFSPWKKEYKVATHLFPLNQYLEAKTYNLVSRGLGFIIRLITLVIAFIVLLLATYIGLLFILLWFCLPVVTLPIYIWQKIPTEFESARAQCHSLQELFVKLWQTGEGQFLTTRLLLPPKKVATLSHAAVDTPLPATVSKAAKLSDLFAVLATWPPFAGLLKDLALTDKDVQKVALWYEEIKREHDQTARFWDLDNLLHIPGIGHDWMYGYIPTLEAYATSPSLEKNPYGEITGRDQEILAIEEVLVKTTNNSVILAGDAGVGKQPLLETLAARITRGQTYPGLRNKRVLTLALTQLLKDNLSTTQAEGNVLVALKEAEAAGDVILIIPDIDRYICESEKALNLSAVFTQVLRQGRLRVIGTTTAGRYHDCIKSNVNIVNLFEKIDISEPDEEAVMLTLQKVAARLENRYHVIVSYQALVEIIKAGARQLPDIPFPQKGIDILDKAMLHAKNQRQAKIVQPEDVDLVVANLSHIPTGKLAEADRDKLLHLEVLLHDHVVDQEEAINSIASALRRAKIDIGNPARPLGVFLFLGPTGVGKTETAKALARIYFGGEKNMIRLDMSQFRDSGAIDRLLGSGKSAGLLTTKVRDNPFAVILLDEFEKTTAEIHNLFLTIFDEGYATAGDGRKVYFNHAIIIATSNAAAEFIREKVQAGRDAEQFKQELVEYVLQNNIFTPELVNRFDEVVIFKPLGPAELMLIARMQLGRLFARIKKEYDVDVTASDAYVADLVREGHDPAFGARELARVIQKRVEDEIAQKILKGELQRGETVEF